MKPERPTRPNRERAITMLAGFLLLGAIYLFFAVQLYGNYLLILDDPANVGGTMEGGLRGWLMGGMAGYYHVYPEWPQTAFSNFYRPVWNLILFFEKTIFGVHYWIWFLMFCALQYLCAFLFLHVQKYLNVSSRPAQIYTILFLFNPAFLNWGFIYPGYQFDVFASLMLLAALYFLLEYRFGLALILITAAVFTKETAIFAPIAAAITVVIVKRDARWAAAMLAPLLVWVAARGFAYHAVMGGTFESPADIRDVLANFGKALTVWPTGAISGGFLQKQAGAPAIAMDASLVINTALWLILAYAGWRVISELWRTPENEESRIQAVLLVWMLGALAFCMVTRPQTRLGASFYVFLLLFLSYFLVVRPRPQYVRWLAILILSLVTLVRGEDFLWRGAATGAADRRAETALFTSLRSLPQDGRIVFVVNAPSMLSAPVYIARSWKLALDIKFINQTQGCAQAPSGRDDYSLSSMALSVKIPSCAYYVFAGVPDEVQSRLLSGGLRRPGVGVYRFPGHPEGKHVSGGDIDFGRTLQVGFDHPPGTILAYDWQGEVFRVLGSGPS